MKRRDALKHTGLLLGGVFISSSLVWEGCKKAGLANYTPQLLSETQMKTIAALVDVILPKGSDTPSASEVGVPAYIDQMLFGFGSPEDNGKALAALDAFDEKCRTDHNKSYDKLSDEEKAAVMTDLAQDKSSEFALFERMKQMAISGYFTSEQVGEKVLNYNPVPSEQAGCVDMSEIPNGRLWSFG